MVYRVYYSQLSLDSILEKVYTHFMRLIGFIKNQRRLNKMTQRDLAEKAGVGIHFIRDLEQGKKTLRMDKVNQVLALFGKELGPIDRQRETGEE